MSITKPPCILQVKAEIIGERYVNAELNLFWSVGIVGDDKAVDLITIVLHLLQGESNTEYAI
jgi:hypothetical protein